MYRSHVRFILDFPRFSRLPPLCNRVYTSLFRHFYILSQLFLVVTSEDLLDALFTIQTRAVGDGSRYDWRYHLLLDARFHERPRRQQLNLRIYEL